MPNYEFIGVSANRLFYSLDRLRASSEFRRMEQVLDNRYDKVVIVMIDNAVPYKTPLGVNYQEATTAVDRTRYNQPCSGRGVGHGGVAAGLRH